MLGTERLWVAGLRALITALAGTLLVRWVAMMMIEVAPDFVPLAGPGPTVFWTTVGVVGATAVYALIRRRSNRPDRVFRATAAVVLVLSFLPDLWLLTDGAAEIAQGVTPAAVAVLMAQHVVAAAAIVGSLTVPRRSQAGG